VKGESESNQLTTLSATLTAPKRNYLTIKRRPLSLKAPTN